MIFTTNRDTQISFNLALIANIEENELWYIVNSFCDSVYIKKDENSQKLFDYFAAKMDKDILGLKNLDTLQSKTSDMLANFDNIQSKFTDMLANLKQHKQD